MSHATVLVIGGGNLEKRMEPFFEQGEEDDWFMEFDMQVHADDAESYMKEKLSEEGNEKFAKKCKENNATLEDFMHDYDGFRFNEEHNGWGYYRNPNAKWDWYQVGGRWTGMLLLKKGKTGDRGERSLLDDSTDVPEGVDSAFACDVDWERMFGCSPGNEKVLRDEWEKLLKGEAEFQFYKPEWYTKRYGNVETYIKEQTSFGTYAVLDKDGEWHEAGEMGWWGMSNCEPEDQQNFQGGYFDTFIKPIMKKRVRITIVDYHI